jgi:hypothetical protein
MPCLAYFVLVFVFCPTACVASAGAPSPTAVNALERLAVARLLRRGGTAHEELARALSALSALGPAAVAAVDHASRRTLLHDALAGLHAEREAGPIMVGVAARGKEGAVAAAARRSTNEGDGGVALVRALLAAGADPDAECPVTHALSYRQLPVARALFEAMSPRGVRACVAERDAHDDKLLHAVVSSRAAGIARHVSATIAAAAAGEGTAAAAAADDALSRDAAALGLACVPRRPRFGDVAACLGAGDVGLLLFAAAGAGVDIRDMMEARDAIGLTPLLRACAQGSAAAFGALVAAGANDSAVSRGAYAPASRGAGRSCAHLAAGAGAMDILLRLPSTLLVATDEAGATPLDVARALGGEEAAAWLAAAAGAAAAAAPTSAVVVPLAAPPARGIDGSTGEAPEARGVDAAGAGVGRPRAARGHGGWRRGSASLRASLGADAAACAVLAEYNASGSSSNGSSSAFDALAAAVLLQRPLVMRGLAADVRARATMTREALLRT